MRKTEPDTIFTLAKEKDPFTGDNPYLRAFMALELDNLTRCESGWG